MSVYYFAFGSNMNKRRLEERKIEFIHRFKGVIRDWNLVFNKINDKKEGAGYANIEPKESSIVEGIIYETTIESIRKLDFKEGFPNHYQRLEMPVWGEDGKFFKCITYIVNPLKVRDGLKPQNEYLAHLLEGKQFLSESYFQGLKNTDTID